MQLPSSVQWTRDTPWRQGCVLPEEAVERLQLTHSTDAANTCVVVISHDCDLANANLDTEAAVEVIPGRIVDAADGNFLGGKSPRALHLKMRRGEDDVVVELLINAKATVRKVQLAEHQPDSRFTLDSRELRTLQRWLASRYFRAAFANHFVDRMKASGASAHLANALKRKGSFISAVYFDIKGGPQIERAPDDAYELTIVLMFTPGANPEESGRRVEELADTIEDGLRAKLIPRHGIKLMDCFPISEDDITVSRARALSEWQLEYMTLRADEEQPGPPGL